MKKNKATRVKVARGYGPRHAENAKEGDLTKVSTDTVPAMLTPREAVLNRNAAEMAGRGNIEALNAQGNKLAQRGVDLAGGGKNMAKQKPKKMQGGGDVKAPPDMVGGFAGPMPPLAWQHKRNEAVQGPGLDWQRRRAAAVGAGQDQPLMPPGAGPFGEPARYGAAPMPLRRLPSGNLYPPGIGMQYGEQEVPASAAPIGTPPSGQEVYGPPVQLSAPQLQRLQEAAKQQGLSSSQIAGIAKAFGGLGGGGGGAPYDALGGSGASFSISGGGNPTMTGYQGGTSSAKRNPYGDSDIMPAIDIEDLATVPTGMGESERRRLLEELRISIPSANDQTMREIERYVSRINAMKDMPYEQYQPPRTPAPRYQGGISDIGYPPFVAPGADYHADKGGWFGPLDPAYTYTGYARGTSSGPGYWT